MEREILHCDMDAFYAAVEQHDRPELRGRPVIVGGSVDRGVVCAASYEARPFGVRSAMAMARALSLCPQAVVLPVRMARYREVSETIQGIFHHYTDRVEPLSLDEAFLDVTGSRRLFGPGREIAAAIRRQVRGETGLAVSAGLAPNKFLAKLASAAAKPDGFREVAAGEVDAFLVTLPVERIWGVGRRTAETLHRLGLRTVADLRRAGEDLLTRQLGKQGGVLYRLAWGEDDRPVSSDQAVKSIGHEETYERDLWRREEIERELLALSEKVAWRLRRRQLGGHTVTLKIKYADFVAISRSVSRAQALDHGPDIFREVLPLLARTEAGRRPVRLLGISLSALAASGEGQQSLFDNGRRSRGEALDRALDTLRARHGEDGVKRGTLLLGEQEKSAAEKGREPGEGP